MNIIEYRGAEAVTLDGTHWDIYVRNRELLRDLPGNRCVQTSDIRYGSWSEEHGLKRGAFYPSEDFKNMESEGEILYQYLLKNHKKVPFPFLDNYELWLLDKNLNPLALIDSCRCETDINQQPLLDWRAGIVCCDEFNCHAYKEMQKLCPDRRSAGTYLTHYINSLCGHTPRAQWFRRTMDGHGIGLNGHNIAQENIGRELLESEFYPFMINDKVHDNQHINLINEFIQWQAPWLLLLDSLSDSQRLIFEDKSRNRAILVDQLHQLYPEILDIGLINVARVEAALRKSNHRPDPQVVNTSTYSTLHPCPYE